MTITIQFAAGTGASSGLIEWFGHGPFSHVDAVENDGSLTGARMDGGVLTRPATYLGGTKARQVVLPCSPEMSAKFYEFIHAQIGKPYDKTAILAFAADRDWTAADSWFCSELIAAALVYCGYFPWALACPAAKVDPDMLVFILSSHVQIVL